MQVPESDAHSGAPMSALVLTVVPHECPDATVLPTVVPP